MRKEADHYIWFFKCSQSVSTIVIEKIFSQKLRLTTHKIARTKTFIQNIVSQWNCISFHNFIVRCFFAYSFIKVYWFLSWIPSQTAYISYYRVSTSFSARWEEITREKKTKLHFFSETLEEVYIDNLSLTGCPIRKVFLDYFPSDISSSWHRKTMSETCLKQNDAEIIEK